MKTKLLAAAGLVFGSGAAALLYQTAWLREFRLVFGSSTAASAAVLGIFMGGLGLGSALLGRRAELQTRPLRFYARLELLIALSAALTPALIWLVRAGYFAMGGTLVLGMWWGTAVRLLLAALVLLVPTFLMGGTLPALARFALSSKDDSRRGLAALYGVNTLGAVTGAGLGTFFLFERCGNHLTLWIACLFNAAVAGVAFLMARGETASEARTTPEKGETAEPVVSPRLVLGAAALSGFLFLVMELVWFRMLSPLLGGTTFTMGLILGLALFGIGAGGVAYAFFGRQARPTLGGLAATCGLEALFLAIPFAMGDRLAVAANLLQSLGNLGFYGRIIAWSSIGTIVIVPAAFVAGIQFPLLISLLGKGRREIGAQTGAAYAWNTGGAIAGSLAGGFLLIPLFSAPGVWRLVVIALSLCAVMAALAKGRGLLRAVPALGTGLLAVCLLMTPGPSAAWRHGQLGTDREKLFEMSPNQIAEVLNSNQRELQWEADGVESSIGVTQDNSLSFIVNGKCDGSARGDAGTQVMAGLLGALFHPEPKRAAVVGLGTGSTAGWLAAIPSVEHVDVMEIEPVVSKYAAQCAPVNKDVMRNPKMRLLNGDAREMLLTLREPYDLIVSEPSNPYRAGIANLFTREYYESARAKLRPGGFFVQWLQTYDVDFFTTSIFYATFSSVFPYVETWHTQGGDLLLIGSQEPQGYDVAALRERIKQPPFKEAFESAWRVDDLEGVFSHFVSNSGFPRSILSQRAIPLNTDDRPVLEFAFARNVGERDAFDFTVLRRGAVRSGTGRPNIRNGELDWPKLEDHRLEMFIVFEQDLAESAESDPGRKTLLDVLRSYSNGRLADVFEQWNLLQREPKSMSELMMLAESQAEKGDPAVIASVRKMRELKMPEATAIAARFFWRQQHGEEATETLDMAFTEFRTNPWPNTALMRRVLDLAVEMSAENAGIARQLYNALEQPFAVSNADVARRDALLRIAVALQQAGDGRFAVAELERAEPFVPWNYDFLSLRETIYQAAHHPRAAAASRDFEAFLKAEGRVPRKTPSAPPADHVASVSH